MLADSLSVPARFDALSVGKVWRVPYQQCAVEAEV
jgi:hypothetical protein